MVATACPYAQTVRLQKRDGVLRKRVLLAIHAQQRLATIEMGQQRLAPVAAGIGQLHGFGEGIQGPVRSFVVERQDQSFVVQDVDLSVRMLGPGEDLPRFVVCGERLHRIAHAPVQRSHIREELRKLLGTKRRGRRARPLKVGERFFVLPQLLVENRDVSQGQLAAVGCGTPGLLRFLQRALVAAERVQVAALEEMDVAHIAESDAGGV